MTALFSSPLIPLALSTAALEVPVFWLCGYQTLHACLWFTVVNFISNVLLNHFLLSCLASPHYTLLTSLGEMCVLLLEYALCCYLPDKKSALHLLGTLLACNLTSALLGRLLFSPLCAFLCSFLCSPLFSTQW